MKLPSFVVDVFLKVILGWFEAIKGPIEDLFT